MSGKNVSRQTPRARHCATRAPQAGRILQPLAVRTEMRGSAAKDDSLDRRPANAAGLFFSSVGEVLVLESASGAVGIDIVAQRAAPTANGAAKGELDRAIQTFDLRTGKLVRRGEWVDPRDEKRFVGINVPQPGDERLIEQRTFDRPRCERESLGQLCDPHFQRLGAQRGDRPGC